MRGGWNDTVPDLLGMHFIVFHPKSREIIT